MMGIYINPPDMSKEAFLEQYGRRVYSPMTTISAFDFSSSYLPVVLVDNGGFTAAAIAYNQQEVNRFLDSVREGDPRFMMWFLVPKSKLQPFFAKHDMIV